MYFLTVLLHSIHSDLAWQPCHWGRRERGEKQDVYSLSLLQQEQEQWCLHISDHSILSSGPPPGAGPLTHSPGWFDFASTKQLGASEGQLLWLAWFDADVFLGEMCHWRRKEQYHPNYYDRAPSHFHNKFMLISWAPLQFRYWATTLKPPRQSKEKN